MIGPRIKLSSANSFGRVVCARFPAAGATHPSMAFQWLTAGSLRAGYLNPRGRWRGVEIGREIDLVDWGDVPLKEDGQGCAHPPRHRGMFQSQYLRRYE